MTANETPPPPPILQNEQYMLFPGSTIHFLQLLEALDPSVSSLHPPQQRKRSVPCHLVLAQSTNLETKYSTRIKKFSTLECKQHHVL